MLKTLVAYRLIDPGSEWRLHRQWFERSAMGDLLGEDFDLVQKDNLYRCLDKLLAHKTELFSFLQQRWKMSIGTQTGPLSASKREHLAAASPGRIPAA